MQLYNSPDDYLYNLETLSSQDARRLWKKTIKDKWQNKCAYCMSTEQLTLDHIIPQIKGGEDNLPNVLCCCVKCNRSKGHQNWETWYKSQEFFTYESYCAINEWRSQLSSSNYKVYTKRKFLNL
jgi:hypothetical protein